MNPLLQLIGFPKHAEVDAQDFEIEEEAPHHSWRKLYPKMVVPATRGAEARLAFKDPGVFLVSRLFRGSLQDAGQKLAAVAEELKKAEEGPQVFAMTPQALGVNGSGRLGGAPLFQSLTSMQMRPTLSGGFSGGFSGMGPYGGFGGDVSSVVNNYKAMASGGAYAPVGWLPRQQDHGRAARQGHDDPQRRAEQRALVERDGLHRFALQLLDAHQGPKELLVLRLQQECLRLAHLTELQGE